VQLHSIAALLCLASACPAGWSQPRAEVSLSGDWEAVKVANLDYPPPAEGWQPFRVPGAFDGRNYERAWFRRSFTVPEAMRGLRLVLHFGGVKYNSLVYVNGTRVGGHFGGYDPFDVDITAAARVGEANTLELGAHDWTGVFSDRETDFSVLETRAMDARELPQDKILAPIGGLWSQYGPWDDVKLRAHPEVWVKDLFIQPSVRKHALRVEYVLENQSAVEVTVDLAARVDDQGQERLALPPATVAIPPGATATAALEAPWSDPRCWSFEDPYLYHLDTTLNARAQTVDQVRTRFGFREFWVDGSHFVLNGNRVNLLATSWWPEMFVTKAHVVEQMRAIKAANCVIFRTHTQPWPELWYETADEVGLMMVPEGAVWNDDGAYRVNDPQFWGNYATHLRALVDREKNRPSVVMYSLENEFYGGRISNDTANKADLAHLGELMHQWDPTRPILYESDGDPGGVADVVGIHYPHEYPDYTTWPNTANWMDTPMDMSGWAFHENPKAWLWDRRKPIYMGEFLWVPSSDPSWHTVFFGDDAYLDYDGYRSASKALSWRMAIEAYRRYEIGGISPWTMVEGGPLDEKQNAMYAAQKAAMQPVAAFVREYDHNVYSGVRVERTADVYNDVLSPSALVFRWALVDGETALEQGQEALSLQPGERREVHFAYTAPAADQRRELKLRVTVDRDGRQVFSEDREVSVFAGLRLQAPAGVRTGLFDPSGETRRRVEAYGWRPEAVQSLDAIPEGLDVLVVGAGALSGVEAREPVIGEEPGQSRGLREFVEAGGRALVLEQTEYPAGVVPVPLLASHASTMTFPQMPGSPLLRGLTAGDLRWWRPDNLVTAAEPARPEQGAARAVVVSGSAAGLAHAPLLELPLGRGTLLLCQLKVVERLGVEPAAGILLQNALEALATPATPPARTALFCPDAATKAYLDRLGLDCVDITADPETADWRGFDLLVATGPLLGLQRCFGPLFELVGRGGSVLLHNLSAEEFEGADTLLGSGLALQPYSGSVVKAPGADPLSAAFANEDLYWLDPKPVANSWSTTARDETMATAAFAKPLDPRRTVEYPNTAFDVQGTYTSNGPEGALLAHGQATATVRVEVSPGGPTVLGVVAGGSAAQGVWPAGSVTVDGRYIGAFTCQQGEPTTYTISTDLPEGEHEAIIRFTNDASTATEDRNLLVRALLVSPDRRSPGVALLTNPAAVAAFRRLGGTIVVDNLTWETNTRNATKAARYVSGLLTGLGARFRAAAGTVYEAVTFEPQPGMPWFSKTPNGAYMGSGGYITRQVRCAREGEYEFRLTGRGTPVEGVYPIVRVELDGQAVGEVELAGATNGTYALPAHITEGEHELRLVFTNDEWAPPEDRNLALARVEVVAAP
jgi:beta-galactosidase